jgi:tetratricopeptide (TPR) repeat protein
MRFTGFLAVAGSLCIATVTASAQQVVERVRKVMPSRYDDPACDISPGHFLVSSGVTYLVTASGGNKSSGGVVEGTTDPQKVQAALENGIRVIGQAIRENDQGDNGAAWYYLGRLHIQSGDIVGADSAFTKAVALLPECAADMQAWRNRASGPLVIAASEFANQGNVDSAMALFRQAHSISRDRPEGFYNMGVLFANLGETDSAIAYFRETQRLSNEDPATFAANRNAATFNLAAMLQRGDRHVEAVEELRQYIVWVPEDTDAKRALATSLRAIGKPDEAASLEKELLAQAEAAGTLSANDRMALGINAFNAKEFEKAAEAFAAILETEPYNRDAMYNLANAYYALESGEKLVELGPKLIALEPLNEDNHKLLAQGYQLTAEQDSLIAAVTILLAMPTSVTVSQFAPSPNGATLVGVARGRSAELDGEDIPPTAQSLTFEFLGADGTVVATTEVELPALEPEATHDWQVKADGAGIIAWRYRVN